MNTILVTIDLDDHADQLMGHAAALASALNAKVWLMHVAAPDPDFVGYEVGPQYIRDSRADELRKEHRTLQGCAKILEDHGVEAEGILVQGATIEMILEESKKLDADLIICGHHEHGFVHDWLTGSIAKALLKKSKTPLLIIPFE